MRNCITLQHLARLSLFAIVASSAVSIYLTDVKAEESRGSVYKPTQDFSRFWSQLREAFLTTNPDLIVSLSQSKKFPLRYGSLDINKKCERDASIAFMKTLLKSFASRPTHNWKEFLTKNPDWNFKTGEGRYTNAAGEHSAHLKVRFTNTGPGKTWKITEVLFKAEDIYKYSKSSGGPAICK